MDKHLGKYPITFIDFKSAPIRSLLKAFSECKRVIRECYLEYEYLRCSSKLDAVEKASFEKCYSDDDFHPESCDASGIIQGLKFFIKVPAQTFW